MHVCVGVLSPLILIAECCKTNLNVLAVHQKTLMLTYNLQITIIYRLLESLKFSFIELLTVFQIWYLSEWLCCDFSSESLKKCKLFKLEYYWF